MSRMMPSVIKVSLSDGVGCERRVSSIGEEVASASVRARTYARSSLAGGHDAECRVVPDPTEFWLPLRELAEH
jgi:hypothetical protein